MAVSYQIPPWIQAPSDPGRNYLAGLQLGVGLAQESRRLSAQQQQAQMMADARQRQLEQDTMIQLQKIEMDKAIQDQMMSLRQQQLDELSQRNALATQKAASAYAAREEYRRRVAGGEDPSAVMLELGPLMEAGMGGYAAALRGGEQTEAMEPGPIEAFPVMFGGKAVEGLLGVPSASGGMTTRAIPGFRPEGLSPTDRASAASYLKEQRRELVDSLPPEPRLAENKPQWEARVAPIKEQIAELDRRIMELLPALQKVRTNGIPKPENSDWLRNEPR